MNHPFPAHIQSASLRTITRALVAALTLFILILARGQAQASPGDSRVPSTPAAIPGGPVWLHAPDAHRTGPTPQAIDRPGIAESPGLTLIPSATSNFSRDILPPYAYDAWSPAPTAHADRADATGHHYDVVVETVVAKGGARFIARTGGEILDVSRIRIPGPLNSPFGKVDYLLGNVGSVESVGKGGFFRGVLGFGEGNLGPALERHLIENFGSATVEGSRIRAIGTLVGPWGRSAMVQSVWQVTPEGFVDLITAVPR